ncbi:hypothetical protein KSP40_PGU015847 [Platanthera guangdongensis]|uniref:Uncharacterized protein n=1 Tax=Platanthera guangdongensis TaxID=2320717 RepID=A0ABR2LTS1_9ASPA
MKKSKSGKANLLHQNGHVLPFKFAKLLDPDASWDKDQLGDALHWIRQVVGLVCGLIWGAIPLVGALWILVVDQQNFIDDRATPSSVKVVITDNMRFRNSTAGSLPFKWPGEMRELSTRGLKSISQNCWSSHDLEPYKLGTPTERDNFPSGYSNTLGSNQKDLHDYLKSLLICNLLNLLHP